MHYDLVLITNSAISNPDLLKFNVLILDESYYLINDYTLNNHLSFDYLITDQYHSLKNVDILKDDLSIVCNYFFQTSKEHIFYIGKENNSSKSIDEQIEIILEFLI